MVSQHWKKYNSTIFNLPIKMMFYSNTNKKLVLWLITILVLIKAHLAGPLLHDNVNWLFAVVGQKRYNLPFQNWVLHSIQWPVLLLVVHQKSEQQLICMQYHAHIKISIIDALKCKYYVKLDDEAAGSIFSLYFPLYSLISVNYYCNQVGTFGCLNLAFLLQSVLHKTLENFLAKAIWSCQSVK